MLTESGGQWRDNDPIDNGALDQALALGHFIHHPEYTGILSEWIILFIQLFVREL